MREPRPPRAWSGERAGAAWESSLDLGDARIVGEDVAVPILKLSGFASLAGNQSAGGGLARAVPVAMLLFPKAGAPRVELIDEAEPTIAGLLARIGGLEEKLRERLRACGRTLDPKAALALAKLRLAGMESVRSPSP